MEFLNFNLETITPVFINGYDQTELRPSSFKGSIRYWFRAAIAEESIQKLHNKEKNIFGSTDKVSTFSIRIKNLNEINNNSKNITRLCPLPHKKEKSNFKLPAFKKDIAFDVLLTQKDKNLDLLRDIFILSLLLGGIGQRSRRGFGSIQDTNVTFNNKGDFLKKVSNILKKISSKECKIKNNELIFATSKKYDYPVIKKVIIGKSFDREKILNMIGNATHNHNDRAIGNGVPRMASPVYITIKKIGQDFYPIITKLEAVYPKKYKVSKPNEKIKKFINELR